MSSKSILKRAGLILFFFVAWSIAGCGLTMDENDRLARAEKFADEGQMRAAVIELKNVLQGNPDSIAGRLMLGKVSLAIGDAPGAEAELRRALELGAPAAEVNEYLAKAWLEQGKYQEVLDEFASQGDGLPGASDSILIARAQLGLGDLDAARASFQAALDAESEVPAALLGLTRVEMASGNQAEAATFIERARAANPEDFEIQMTSGSIFYREQKPKLAVDHFSKALALANGQQRRDREFAAQAAITEVQLDSGDLAAAKDSANALLRLAPKHPMANFLAARVAYESKDLDTASSRLQDVLAVAPNHKPSKMLLGAVNLAQGKSGQAEMYLSAAASGDTDNTMLLKMLASARMQQGKPEMAMVALKPVIELTPDDPDILDMLGAAALQQGDVESGIDYLEQSQVREPENRALALNLARAYLSAGRFTDGIKLLSSLPASPAAEYPNREILLVLAYLRSGDNVAAENEAGKLISNRPDSALAHNLAGGVAQTAGNIDEAREHYQRALKLDPDDAAIITNLGRLELASGNLEKAEKHFRDAIQVDEKNVLAMMVLASQAERRGDNTAAVQWLEKARSADATAVSPRLLLSRYYLAKGEVDRARTLSEETLKLEPAAAEVLLNHGNILMASGDTAQALKLYESAAKASPDAAEPLFRLGAARLAAGDVEMAKASLNRALEKSTGHLQAALLLSAVEMTEGKPVPALNRVRAMQARYPDRPEAFVAEGDLLMVQGDFPAASRAYQAAWKHGQSLQLALKIRAARQRAGQGDLNQALESWAKEQPADMVGQFRLAQAYQEDGFNVEAAARYETVLTAQPENVVALNNLAWLYYLQKDPRALAMAERASELAPDSGAVTDTLGWILFESGKTKRAEVLLEKAATQSPDNLDIQYHLAAAYAGNGKNSKAKALLSKILDDGKPFGSIEDARSLLSELGG